DPELTAVPTRRSSDLHRRHKGRRHPQRGNGNNGNGGSHAARHQFGNANRSTDDHTGQQQRQQGFRQQGQAQQRFVGMGGFVGQMTERRVILLLLRCFKGWQQAAENGFGNGHDKQQIYGREQNVVGNHGGEQGIVS